MERHVCPGCGKPRELEAYETFFTALGAPAKFSQDIDELQSRFYEISRALHPDRFGTADAASRRCSLERMSFLNEAYATLRDRGALREYILTLHGLKAGGAPRGQIPMALAERWFELQDDLSEEGIVRFRAELKLEQEKLDARIKAIEDRLDLLEQPSDEFRKSLEELAEAAQQRNYLSSMNREAGLK